jgi:hypothetical protein
MIGDGGHRIFEQVAGQHSHHGLIGADRALGYQPARAGHSRRRCRLTANTNAINQRLSIHNLGVANLGYQPIGPAHSADGPLVADRRTDANGSSHRLCLHGDPLPAGSTLQSGGPQ